MFAVFAAEQQYRHDIRALQREHELRVTIRERSVAVEPRLAPVVRRADHPQGAGWPRPIGLHSPPVAAQAAA
jgi:hypothetical protein